MLAQVEKERSEEEGRYKLIFGTEDFEFKKMVSKLQISSTTSRKESKNTVVNAVAPKRPSDKRKLTMINTFSTYSSFGVGPHHEAVDQDVSQLLSASNTLQTGLEEFPSQTTMTLVKHPPKATKKENSKA